LTIED